MKTSAFLGLTVSMTLVCSTGLSGSNERKPAEGASSIVVKTQHRTQNAEFPDKPLTATQLPHTGRIITSYPQDGGRIRVFQPDPYAGCKIRIIKPNPNVDYKIVQIRPDPNVDYKIRNLHPGGRHIYVVPRAHGRRTIAIVPIPRGRAE